ncbi:uncharacterized protein LOC106161042 [Lingula anatina]|uniref:Uncharacterized protein LOC106161042 n=1 Tax=Lingula anatina TaxID=7574 RepID=A0A1S3I530_LINAN|nr:uncharacterized protein LOC106161042 [Lingula anatina]|eukprot:XP_013393328.1 uncharacterized protein LOC106161042 [Lingula anatina]
MEKMEKAAVGLIIVALSAGTFFHDVNAVDNTTSTAILTNTTDETASTNATLTTTATVDVSSTAGENTAITTATTTSNSPCPSNTFCKNGQCSLNAESQMQCQCYQHFFGTQCTIADLTTVTDNVDSRSVSFTWPSTPSLSGYSFLYYETAVTNGDARTAPVTVTSRSATLSGLNAGMVLYVVCLVPTSTITGMTRDQLRSDAFRTANKCVKVRTGYDATDPYTVSFYVILSVLGGVLLLISALGCVAACGRRMLDSEKSKSWKWVQRLSATLNRRSGSRSGSGKQSQQLDQNGKNLRT